MTAVAIEITLPAEHQTLTGVMDYRAKLAQAATELGWPMPHHTDTVCRLAGGVPVHVAMTREKQPVAIALHWQIDDDRDAICRVLAAIRDTFDVEYMTVDASLIAADDPEILAEETTTERKSA